MESGLEIICRVFWIDRFGAIDARLGDGIMRGDSFVADSNCSVIIIGSVEQHLFKLNLLRGVERDFLPRLLFLQI